MRKCIHVVYDIFIILLYASYVRYKLVRSALSIILKVSLMNNGNANLLVPKSDVLSPEATFSNLISLFSTFSFINISAKSKCFIPSDAW